MKLKCYAFLNFFDALLSTKCKSKPEGRTCTIMWSGINPTSKLAVRHALIDLLHPPMIQINLDLIFTSQEAVHYNVESIWCDRIFWSVGRCQWKSFAKLLIYEILSWLCLIICSMLVLWVCQKIGISQMCGDWIPKFSDLYKDQLRPYCCCIQFLRRYKYPTVFLPFCQGQHFLASVLYCHR